MKKLNLIITIIIALAIVSCASVEHENSEAMELLYETDFSSDDGAFKIDGREIIDIQDEVLHLNKETNTKLERTYGNNSTTTFRIKFGDPVSAHINFLQREGYRLLVHLAENNIAIHSLLDDKNLSEVSGPAVKFTSGRWYDVAVSIVDYKLTVSIDGVELGTIALDNRLPAEGNMSFECHEEYWIDDLRIVTESSGMKEQPAASSGVSVLYETDFSSDDGAFEIQGREKIDIQDEVMHLNKQTYTVFERDYGNNSTTTFRIKFGDPVSAHINFLQREGYRLLVHLQETNIAIHQLLDDEKLAEVSGPLVKFTSGRWYDVAFSIINYNFTVSVDGVDLGTVALDNRLPADGNMSFGCHEEYWIDDLRIVTESSGIEEQEQPASIAGGALHYETDFSSDDGGLGLDPPGEINEISNGVLHLKAIKDGQAAHAGLKEVYGNNSITTFRIKFGERYRKEGGFADVNFLWLENDRVKTTFADDAFYIWTRAAGQEDLVRVPANFTSGRWYDVQAAIEDYRFSISIDGRLLKTVYLDKRLPSQGHLNFECHEEYWVDNLRVVAAKAAGVVERKPEQKKAEREAEKVEVQRELGDSRIAVVGIKTEDDQEKTAAALVSFVIDAFVNTGIGKVMERQDISKILEEYEFQREDITDQSTAIEIGRLAGADVISIGALYKVGSKHYLNIKLISVKTGEIMASSVATAETEDDYFNMCNEAVRGMLR